jgi:hypothetical protein
MNRLTAEDCRQLVGESKIENIYQQIAVRARQGHGGIIVAFISEDCFKHLKEDGFKIYTEDGESELTQYDQETVYKATGFEIAWEEV